MAENNEAEKAGISQRGWSNVAMIMPKIRGAVAERANKTSSNIDLSTAENWLIREEVLEICRTAIQDNLKPKVCHNGFQFRKQRN